MAQIQIWEMTVIIYRATKIYIDTEGGFQEDILLYPGINLITIKSLDRFGKEVKKEVSIYYNSKLTIAK
jgi:predicted nucleic-acid-binding protein